MSQERDTWSLSQKVAFPYIQSAINQGLNATESLEQYRQGGGSIRDNLWYSLFRETFGQIGVTDKIQNLPMSYKVSDPMFQEVDWDLRGTYAIQMKVSGYSEELGMRLTKWITVESDELLTKKEWQYYAQMAVTDTIGSPPFIIDTFLEYTPIKRMS
jgi:hypothetical protein